MLTGKNLPELIKYRKQKTDCLQTGIGVSVGSINYRKQNHSNKNRKKQKTAQNP